MGTRRSALRLASALWPGLLGWGCGTDRAPLPDGDAEERAGEPVEQGTGDAADEPLEDPSGDDAGEPSGAAGAAQTQAHAPSGPEQDASQAPAPQPPAPPALPLALCEKYFPHSSPLPIFSMAAMAFWAEDNCAIAGLFTDIDESIEFLNYLRDWSLLIVGCEAPRDVPGGAETFGLSYLRHGAPLAQADLDALIDHFMRTLSAALPLEPDDEAKLRAGLVGLSREVPLCDCPPELDLCAEDAQPTRTE